MHLYEVRPRRYKRGVDLISDALPFGALWYTKPDDAVSYAAFFSRSRHAIIRVYDDMISMLPLWVCIFASVIFALTL